MQATLNPASNDPHDVLEIAPDIVLVARAEEELSKLARDAKARQSEPRAPQPSQPTPGPTLVEDSSVPPIDTAFRATAVNRSRPSGGARVIRRLVGVLLAIGLGVALLTLKVGGDVAQRVITTWIPQFAARSGPPDNTEPVAQPSEPAVQAAAATAPPAQAAPAAQTGQDSAVPAAPAPSPDQMMQSMAHHLENVGQELEELKAQIAELRANQEQMSRDIAKETAKTAEQKLKLSALPPRPAPPPPRRAPQVFRPAQTAAAPVAPPPAVASVPPPQGAAPYPPPPAASTYAPPPQGAVPPAAYDPNAPRPPLPVRE